MSWESVIPESVLFSGSVQDHFAGRRVLVAGGMGFVGSNLTHALVRLGAEVTVVDNLQTGYGGNPFNLEGVADRVAFNELDVVDVKALCPLVEDVQDVFNLVGQVSHIDSLEDPFTDLRTNVTAQVGLLEACRRSNPKVKVLFAGTRGQYGRPGPRPVDENAPIAPIDVNGVNKHAGEMYHFLYARLFGLRACSLRLTNTYGPRHTMRTARQGVFAWFIRQALDGETIRLYGGGEQLRDFNHVNDVVAALLVAMASPAADGQVFNLGSGQPISLLRMAELIVRTAGTGTVRTIEYPEELKPIEVGDYSADHGKIRRVLGWEPRVPLEEGVARTVAYYQRHRERYWKREVYP